MLPSESRKVILGLGNILNRDEGFGIHALQVLQEKVGLPPDVELVDGGVLGMNLLPLVESCSHLLVLDAVDAGLAPGTLVEWQDRQIPLYSGTKLSEHQVSFQEVLGLALFRDAFPNKLHLIGVQPGDVSIGIGLSQAVQAALPDAIDSAKFILDSWGNKATV